MLSNLDLLTCLSMTRSMRSIDPSNTALLLLVLRITGLGNPLYRFFRFLSRADRWLTQNDMVKPLVVGWSVWLEGSQESLGPVRVKETEVYFWFTWMRRQITPRVYFLFVCLSVCLLLVLIFNTVSFSL